MTAKKPKKFFPSKFFFSQILFTLLGALILALISVPLARNISQRYRIDNDVKQLQTEINSIEGKNTKLKKMINYLGSDQFAEEQARLKLGLKKPGEEVVAIRGAEETANGEPDSDKPVDIYKIAGLDKQVKKTQTNPERWWKYYFNSASQP
jgi:cell division protein FtsB